MNLLILLLLNYVCEINSRLITNPSPSVSSYCGSKYYFLNSRLTNGDATRRCLELGYDGLAVLIRPEQKQEAESTIIKASNSISKEFWIALEYLGPTQTDWQWKRKDSWLSVRSEFNIPWANNEPNHVDSEKCCRVTYLPTRHQPFMWRSNPCTARNYLALCQKVDLPFTRESRLELYQANRAKPIDTAMYRVRSAIECSLLCLEQCTCRFTYHFAGSCHIVTGSATNLNDETGLGNYYRKISLM